MYNTANTRHSIYAFDVLYSAWRASGQRGDAMLHRALGGDPGIRRIVDTFIALVASDRRVSRHFGGINVVRLRLMLCDHFCWLAGGPEADPRFIQTGAHADAVDYAAFAALTEALESALLRVGIPQRTRSRFVALFSTAERIAA